MADESKYLQENYDGDAEQRNAQKAEDIENAKKMAQEVEEVQQSAYEIFEDECIDLIGISDTRYEELMKKSNESDALHQYLVDGALLTCTQATLEDFILPGTDIFFLTEVISLDQVDEDEQQKQPVDLGTRCQRLQTRLNVPENPIGINGQPYATVKDTIKGRNIMPFRCNCRVPADRDEEKEIIAEHLALCRENGVCQYLMRLNEEWDNMLLDGGKKYLMRRDIKADEDRPAGKDTEWEEVEGITRTSVLFCKHGGLIVPLTSGQGVSTMEEVLMNCESELDASNPESVMNYMWNFFINENFSEIAVAGILGNVYVESYGFKPDADNGRGYIGLFQYGDDRREDFEGKAGAEGWEDVQFQCEYALWEYNSSGNGWITAKIRREDGTILRATKEEFENAQNVVDATLAWGVSYERCVDKDNRLADGTCVQIQHQQRRIEAAEKIYGYFVNGEDIDLEW